MHLAGWPGGCRALSSLVLLLVFLAMSAAANGERTWALSSRGCEEVAKYAVAGEVEEWRGHSPNCGAVAAGICVGARSLD